MVKQRKKLWAHYEQIGTILGFYITLFFCVPLLSLGFSCLAHSSDIDAGVQDAVKIAIFSGLKWYAIIMPIITALYLIWFIFSSGTVEFTDDAIQYYKFIFSKKFKRISYERITECVVAGRLWNDKREYSRKRAIILFHKANRIMVFDIYSRLVLMLALHLPERKLKLVTDKGNSKTISKYYDIDFMNLGYTEQLKILNHYCKLNYPKYKTGEEILSKKK